MYDNGGPVIGGALATTGAMAATGATTFAITLAIVCLLLGALLLWRSRYLARMRVEAPVTIGVSRLAVAPERGAEPGEGR